MTRLKAKSKKLSGLRASLFLFSQFLFSAFPATIYYVSPTGSDTNTGLSPDSPWTVARALTQVSGTNTLVFMDGQYASIRLATSTFSGMTFIAQHKWAAIITNAPDIGFETAEGTHHLILDGLAVTNAASDGIKLNGNFNTVRNCWVTHCGDQGIASHSSLEFPANDCTFENNLSEYNGDARGESPDQDHGLFVSGARLIIRNNVCRFNGGEGICLYPEDYIQNEECHVYNNLVYSNQFVAGYGGGILIYTDTTTNALRTNYVYGNTVIEPYATDGALTFSFGFGCVTNNILVSPNSRIQAVHGATVWADYNAGNDTIEVSGGHDLVTNYLGFVSTNTGRYWLKSDSPARGAALATVHGPVNFFGTNQTSATDIGAFQYSPAQAADARTLDPSPPGGANYWLAFSNAQVTLANLSQRYDGSGKSVTATTVPAGLNVSLTYDGSAAAPTNAGSYAVTATVVDVNYAGSINGTLTISKSNAPVALANLSRVYDGSGKSAEATTVPPGLNVNLRYAGSANAPTNAGSYAVTATVVESNYAGGANGTLTITRSNAPLTLANLNQVYDGRGKNVTATTVPAGLNVSLTYGGSAVAPTNVGSYAVTATVVDVNYAGSKNGTLNVAPPPTLTVNPTTLSFSVLQGAEAGNQALAVFNNGGGTLNWSAVADGSGPSWLALGPTNGTGNGTVGVAVTSASLTPGNYGSTITVSAVGATNSPQTVTVNLTVTKATNYYASPSGSVENTGWSTNSPWTIDWAVDHAGASNIVNMMDGDYPSFIITQAWLTVKAINKWQARVTNAPDVGVFGTDNTDGITLDGIQVTNSLKTGIETAGDFITIRNCWVHHCADSGIATYQTDTESVSYNLFEGNLVEYNGDARGEVPNLGHGIYVGGVHNTIRNNVSRYNGGFGIQIYPRPNQVMDQNTIYQNLCYGNNFYLLNAGGGIVIYAHESTNVLATNHIWGNTVIEPYGADGAVVLRYGFAYVNNNILVNPNDNIHAEGGVTVWADYNAGSELMEVSGGHDVITNDLGFVSTNTGCYWLKSDSPARRAALPSVYGSLNFFGTNQTSVTDIGAFQYSAAQAGDPRTLDPSPTDGANYWLPISNARVTLANLSQVYDGSRKSVTATTVPAGLNVNLTYDGSAAAPTNVGSYAVSATVGESDYVGSTNGTLTISKRNAPVTLANLSQIYDGRGKSVTATTVPAGLNVSLTYGGSTFAPINVGNYAVTAVVVESNYAGSANGMLTIIPPPTLTVSPTTLDFSVPQGTDAGNQSLAVSNSGGGTLNWSAVAGGSAPSWLALSPTNGTGNGTVSVAVTSASLTPGDYSRTITVSAVGATNSPQTVTVNLTVAHGLSPLITSFIATNGGVVITWTATAGKTYKVQSKAELSDLEWSDFSPDILATGPTAVYANVSDLNDRFFRILLVQ